MYEYTNAIKLARAKASLGADATEEQIKDEYLRIGGLIAGYVAPQVVVPIEEPVIQEETPVVEQKVVKQKKVAKKVTKKK